MSDQDQGLAARYNYDSFVPGKFDQFMTFDESPTLGEPAPDAALWCLEDSRLEDGRNENHGQTALSEIRKQHDFTVVEFGSFT